MKIRLYAAALVMFPSISFAEDAPKRDVRGVYLGMLVTEAHAELKKQGAVCSPISIHPMSACDFDPRAEIPTIMKIKRSLTEPARVVEIDYTFRGTAEKEKIVSMYGLTKDTYFSDSSRYLMSDGTKVALTPGHLDIWNEELANELNKDPNDRPPGPAKF